MNAWPCDDYKAPLTCYTTPKPKTLTCQGCRTAFPNGPQVRAMYATPLTEVEAGVFAALRGHTCWHDPTLPEEVRATFAKGRAAHAADGALPGDDAVRALDDAKKPALVCTCVSGPHGGYTCPGCR